MFTPQQRGTPRGVTGSVERREKGKLLLPEFASAEAGGSGGVPRGKELAGVSGTSNGPVDENGLIFAGLAGDRSASEQEIWKQFKDAGALDEESLERKDRAALLAHISSLEAELYDYQYQMGLLLLESKSWGPKFEKMKCAIADTEENLKREQAAHMIAIAEAERREDALKKALSTERQCVADLEKALKEMHAELAEVKEDAAKQVSQAKYMVISLEEKSVNADSRLHAGEAIYAQASRKQAEAERKLQEVQAREDALRREQHDFKISSEARKCKLDQEEESLREWEKRLLDGQSRLLDGEKSLNKREEYADQKESDLRKLEDDLKLARKQLEQSRLQYKQDENDLEARVAAVSLREESAVKKEVALDKKEQEVLLLQERVASRECIFEQHEHHVQEREMFNSKERERLEALERSLKLREDSFTAKKQELDNIMRTLEETREEEIRTKLELQRTIDELDRLRELMKVEQDDLGEKRKLLSELEIERSKEEEKLLKREQQLEKKSERLKDWEQELHGKLKAIKERERALKNEEKQVAAEKHMLEQEKEGIVMEKEELRRLQQQNTAESQRLEDEKEKLKALEREREDLLLLKNQLKGEIDELRARKYEFKLTAEELKKEKDRFEKEWELLDERKEQLKKEQDSLEQESYRIAKWVQDEEERMRKEKREMHEKYQREKEAIGAEKRALLDTSEADKRKLLEMVAKEREDLARDIEVQRVELERNIEIRRAEVEKEAEELKLRLNEEIHRAQEEIHTSREGVCQVSEEFSRLRSKFDQEKQEISKQREEAEEKWLEIKKDIEELQLQREKLKEQRESLRREREEVLREAEQLKKLRDGLKEGDDSKQISEEGASHKHANDSEALSPQRLKTFRSHGGQLKEKINLVHAAVASECSPSKVAVSGGSTTPRHLSWLQRCTLRFFTNTVDKSDSHAPHSGSNGLATTKELTKEDKLKLCEPLPNCCDHTPDSGMFGAIDPQEEREGGNLINCPTDSHRIDRGSMENVSVKDKRTHSIKTAMEDAKFLLQEAALGRQAEAVLSVNEEREKDVDYDGSGSPHQDSRLTYTENNTDQKGFKARRKRNWRLSKSAVEEEGDIPEVDSHISVGGRKRRRRKEPSVPLSINGHAGKGGLSAKRYNLRHSTIVNMGVTQLATGEQNGINQNLEETPTSRKAMRNTSRSTKEDISKPYAAKQSLGKARMNEECHSVSANAVQQSNIAELSCSGEGKIEALDFQESCGLATHSQSHEKRDNPAAELGEGSSGSQKAEAKEVVRGEAKESSREKTSGPGALAEQNLLGAYADTAVEDADASSCEDEDETLEDDFVENMEGQRFGKKLWDFLTT